MFKKSKTTLCIRLRRGFTLIEVVVGSAIFLFVALAVYQTFVTTFKLEQQSHVKVVATQLAREQFEIVRNLPYALVGEQGGLPTGSLLHNQTLTRSGISFNVVTTVRNLHDPFSNTAGATSTTAFSGDYKLVQVDVNCQNCSNQVPMHFVTTVGPLGLQTLSSNGALVIQAFNANGQPIANANVHVVNNQASPAITIDDVTSNSGILQLIDAPPGSYAYQVTVSKPGYSTDTTYAVGAPGNPNPLKPYATVVAQQATQLSFVIDQLSTLNISSVTNTCTPVPSISFSLTGSKLIGTNPNVYKYSQNLTTNNSGLLTLSNMEWDNYTAALNDASYSLAGTNPIVPFSLSPNANQNLQLIVHPKNPDELLLAVEDTSTQLPLSNASVELQGGTYDKTLLTGQGFLNQSNWSGGSGQASFTNPTMFWSTDGNIDYSDPVAGLKLASTSGAYVSSGYIVSSTFDTGAPSNFYQISWQPQSQPVQSGTNPVLFQIAANNDNATWNFLGPDGTSNTYYSIASTTISSVHNGNRFIRYKLYMQTANTAYTPVVSNAAITFSSQCVPPGQVNFSGLASGTYTYTVTRSGYQVSSSTVSINSPWQQVQVNLSP